MIWRLGGKVGCGNWRRRDVRRRPLLLLFGEDKELESGGGGVSWGPTVIVSESYMGGLEITGSYGDKRVWIEGTSRDLSWRDKSFFVLW